MKSIFIVKNRRFTCLSDGLIRMEFSPNAVFEDRRSIVAYEARSPIPFKNITENSNGSVVLETALMSINSTNNEKPFDRYNLEITWKNKDYVNYWRPYDTDHLNLGGTLHSLDFYGNGADMSQVQPAGSHPLDITTSLAFNNEIDKAMKAVKKQDGFDDYDLDRMFETGIFNYVKEFGGRIPEKVRNIVLELDKFPPGILSKSGYYLLNDSDSCVMDDCDFPIERERYGCSDWYFFCYGNKYKAALADYIKLTGKVPMIPRNVFGIVFSRWPAYSHTEAVEIVENFSKNEIPLSTLVIDMEWHKNGWNNWDINPDYYPDLKASFDWLHSKNIAVTLNTHPERVVDFDSHYEKFISRIDAEGRLEKHDDNHTKIEVNACDRVEARVFMEVCHDEFVEKGMDFWWLDGTNGNIIGTDTQLVINKLFYENVKTDKKRGMLLSRHGGLGSHRYGAFFTGDTFSEWEVLSLQCRFNIRAGHVGVCYLSHDIGGFNGPKVTTIDPIKYIRWLQFGVFNPVLRFHSAPGAGSRLPWDYGMNADIAKKWLKIRNSLIPYIYSNSRIAHDTGIPIVRGLFLEHPDDEKAYIYDEFYFGESMIAAPILSANNIRSIYLPDGDWYDFNTGKQINGSTIFTTDCDLKDAPLYIKAGSIIPRQGYTCQPADITNNLILDIYPDKTGECIFYEDDGKTYEYLSGSYMQTKYEFQCNDNKLTLTGSIIDGTAIIESRSNAVHIATEKTLKTVEFNGVVLSDNSYKYDDTIKRLIIDLGIVKCADSFELMISF